MIAMSERRKDCYDVITGLDESMREAIGDTEYYVLGGIATKAMTDPNTKFDHDTRTIIVADNLGYPLLREENDTKRDIDILILNRLNKQSADIAVEAARRVIGDELAISVFGLDEHRVSLRGIRKTRYIADALSKRTIDDDGVIRQELYPLSQVLPTESFEPWYLNLPRSDERVAVFNPVGHSLAYKMRSVSGERYKDRKKIPDMDRVVYDDETFRDQVNFGPFKVWRDFADAIKSLQRKRLHEIDESMIDTNASTTDMALFGLKAKLLAYAESQESIIEWAQSDKGEKLLKPFIRQH